MVIGAVGYTYKYNHQTQIEKLAESVVLVELPNSKGTGFFIANNLIMTNAHVVHGALGDVVSINFRDGRKLSGKVIRKNTGVDLAIVELDPTEWKPFENKPDPLKFCKDTDNLPLGTRVVTIGHPLLFDWIASEGIVSRNQYSYPGSYSYFIVTDNKIYQGNSGGPMFLDSGCVAGVSVQLLNSNGQIYAMSIAGDFVTSILDRLIVDEFDIPKFGIGLQGEAILSLVIAGGEWDRAGIKTGDKLIRINDRPIKRHQDIIKTFTLIEKGDNYRVVVEREGAYHLFEILSEDRSVPERDMNKIRGK